MAFLDTITSTDHMAKQSTLRASPMLFGQCCQILQNKKQHSAENCLKCVDSPAFAKKKLNSSFTKTILDARNAKRPITLHARNTTPTEQTNSVTPPVIPQTETFQNQASSLFKAPTLAVKRKLLTQANREQKKACLAKEVAAVYGGGTTLSAHERLRMRTYGEYRTHAKRSHTGTHELLYNYDVDIIVTSLLEVADENKELGSKMNRKWSELGRKANLRSITGANNIPTTQVFVLSQQIISE